MMELIRAPRDANISAGGIVVSRNRGDVDSERRG